MPLYRNIAGIPKVDAAGYEYTPGYNDVLIEYGGPGGFGPDVFYPEEYLPPAPAGPVNNPPGAYGDGSPVNWLTTTEPIIPQPEYPELPVPVSNVADVGNPGQMYIGTEIITLAGLYFAMLYPPKKREWLRRLLFAGGLGLLFYSAMKNKQANGAPIMETE